ncbi:MAG: bifunctional [glutamate--ammonia ligase]-adenylyl-L-tyrosine phosphorylase/[glutamate--ammonia-ligase] adenylyltransferase [Betaproteobacteria bacterium]|nr:bifunctional [glutamate--ammonia ligase]-adenylyl-L-tyrosine phosphorylase/[glutamate--ammonia-ligase] adenylyltransferase [Betaproteobacteria bacterium]
MTALTFDAQLAKTFRASRYAERMCNADAGLTGRISEGIAVPLSAETMLAWLNGDKGDERDEAAFHARLRSLRRYAMVHTIFRDINGLGTFAEVVGTISALADVTLTAAQRFHARAMAERFSLDDPEGEHAQLLIVGMGKLGGRELNVSSDIDLIFVHAENGEANSHRSWHEFHAELGKRIIRAIDHVDADGFVFRVDMRLRPFGDSGPLVSSLAALETYFITQARAWERYAWLKGRAITGAAPTIAALETLVRSFVYRRYHDYAAIEEMRDLHGQIRAEATKRNRLDDIKVGVGGIREIEFIAQLFQLIRGGREASLQTRSTREALAQLDAHRILTAERVTALQLAYTFLRNLEHRLQYLDDQQTQSLPGGEDDRQRIAEAMNYPDWESFLVALNRHRDIVTGEFEALFSAPAGKVRSASAATPGAEALGQEVRGIAAALGPEIAETIGARIDAWFSSSRTVTLSARSRARMETLIPFALKAALHEDHAPATAVKAFFRLFDLIEAIDKRETYLALLVEYPQVLERVARIAANSAWAADFLRRHPILLDELITPADKSAALDWRAERRALQAACDAADGDIEKQYELLRHAKQVATLKLNVADIEGRLSVMALSDELSALADMLLDVALVLAWRALNSRQTNALPADARPPKKAVPQSDKNDWQSPAGFAIIGYGKLGSKELGYASDLDLVFLYDPAAGIEPDRYAKLAQRLTSWLNTMTAGGVLYETDLRLRPDGDSGRLVSSLDAFHDYQLKRAWTWEHQALTRARFCAGDASMAAPFESIRREVLAAPRDKLVLRGEITDMRDKMRAEKRDRADQLDLKHTLGGIVDVEFIVQYLILAYSHEHPEFLGNLGNFALLTRAAALGIIDEGPAAIVAKAYLTYRERQHRARNNNELKTWVGLDEFSEERQAVVRVWKGLFG